MAEAIAMGGLVTSVAAATAGVVQAVSQAKPVFWDPVTNKYGLSDNGEEIIDALDEAARNLGFVKTEFETKVQRNKMKEPSDRYLEWISSVGKIENQVKDLKAKNTERGKEEASFWFFSSSCLVEEMKKTFSKVMHLLQESDQIRFKMFVDQLPEVVVKRKGPGIKHCGTHGKQIEEILGLLRGSKVNKIGIHGTVGIGKTTMMLNLNNHEQFAKTFDFVIWLTVSKERSRKNLSTEDLQLAIVQRLKLEIGGASNADEVAERILMELKGKKYLLLLDDVKEKLDLKKIGIPESNNGSKIVLTTRLRHVCSSMVDMVIKVTYLSLDESWKMFRDVLESPRLLDNPKIRKLALRVCKECSGLPLLIEKVANTFKLKNTEYLWSDGLDGWRMWPEKECQGIREMYELLKFCYDDLDDERYKKCFLYGALYPEDSVINTDCLLECWAAENLHGKDDGMTKESLIFGHHALIHLKNVSLLEEVEIENHITMHKFIRQVALYISDGDHECKSMVKTSRALREPPKVEDWTEKNRISLGDNKLERLPDSPTCSMLSTLFLQKNLSLKTIPTFFFEHMKKLRVLDLSHTGIDSLPSSLSILLGLKALYLNNCQDLAGLHPHIVELLHLEALDIMGSGVNNIPPGIEKLIGLRRLRVSFSKSGNGNASQEVHFNYDVISKLSRLEELVIDVKSPENWSDEVVENIIKEVATLQNFKSLKFHISNKVVDIIEVFESQNLRIRVPDATILQSFIERSSWRNVQDIKNFEFYIGCENSEHPHLPNFEEYVKYLKYCEVEGRNSPNLEVLTEADAFELVNNRNIKQLSDLEFASMNGIESCLIESCDAIETIVGTVDSVVLPNLEHLFIKDLQMLESIWKGPLQPGSLARLTTLVLTSCQIMVKVFPTGAIQQLREIQKLTIEKCPEIEEIIPESEAVGNLAVLPKLKELILLDMTKLSSICAIESLEWPSLEKLKIFKCPALHKLPFNKDNAANLEIIEAEQSSWDALQWQDPEVKERLQKLCTLGSCNDAAL